MITDTTFPGKSLNAQFDLLWRRFQRLSHTRDTINRWPMRIQRWLRPVNVSFIVPIDQEDVCCYLGNSQEALHPYLYYAPQPSDKLHITLFQVGYLRTGLPLPGTWTNEQLGRIAALAQENLRLLAPFEVRVGPINAFPNVPIAEVHDDGKLRLLRAGLSQATPRLPRPLPSYPLIPHITLGYFGYQAAAPIREVMQPLHDLPSIPLWIDKVELTIYYRKPGPYDPRQSLLHSSEEVLYTLYLGDTPGK